MLVASLLSSCAPERELPVLFELPPHELVAQSGEPVSVPGANVAIVDFIFTRCGASCPMLTERMRDLTIRLDDPEVAFYSITVDPGYDTTEVLRRYREQTTRDERWQFLTGSREEVLRLVTDGFKLGVAPSDDPREPILHSTRFVLVDPAGGIRGYYDAFDREQLDQLLEDAETLIREEN